MTNYQAFSENELKRSLKLLKTATQRQGNDIKYVNKLLCTKYKNLCRITI